MLRTLVNQWKTIIKSNARSDIRNLILMPYQNDLGYSTDEAISAVDRYFLQFLNSVLSCKYDQQKFTQHPKQTPIAPVKLDVGLLFHF